ncbi:hypothetical protein [Sphingomonas bacterium]|uniref:hypothetical protein n=1 Tax=Sphingomonas bacterium TaxID=1895847 RepID=UPI00157739E6|nr:hypothetical protein [Sphingomonas bacterium]
MAFHYILLDTSAMPVADVADHPGARVQTLLRDEDFPGAVEITFGPSGFTGRVRELLSHGPHRHYHRSVNERHYVLEGDYPIYHWKDPSGEGSLTRLQRHHYLENPPMTLHGITADTLPELGWKHLRWSDGLGTDIYEPGAAEETLEVGFTQPYPAVPFTDPILLHAEELPWQPSALRSGWRTKQLTRGVSGARAVTLVSIPAGSSDRIEIGSPAEGESSWLFVISGDLALEIVAPTKSHAAKLHEGGFLAWAAGSAPRSDGAPLSDGGCVLLCVGHTLGAVAVK